MIEAIDKFVEIENELSSEKGAFNLFALFLRENSLNKWDLLVSADWMKDHYKETLQAVDKKIQEKLDVQEIMKLSRIVVIQDDNPGLDSFYNLMERETGITEFRNRQFFGLDIKHAIVITSRREAAKAS